jgi:hypothetical protein
VNKNEINECTGVLNSVLNLLLSAVPSSSSAGINGAKLRADVGALSGSISMQLAEGTAATALQQCFSDATTAGATFASMSSLLTQINALTSATFSGVQLVQLCVVLALTQIAIIVAQTTYTDRETVEQTLLLTKQQFDPAIENAADDLATELYLTLIQLQSLVVQYLVNTEQPLPFIVGYQAGRSLPSLTLAMRLYADTADVEALADSLLNENAVVNPAFMPQSGIALSAP